MKKAIILLIAMTILCSLLVGCSASGENVIPKGGTYYVGVTSTELGNYGGATHVYRAGQQFPETVKDGDVYVYGDYEYRYNMSVSKRTSSGAYVSFPEYFWLSNNNLNKWGVRILDRNKEKYGVILESVNGVLTDTSHSPIDESFSTLSCNP
jgi:hypothetical protein